MKRLIASILLLVSVNFLSAQNVILSEFMASNSRTLQDQDGDFSDWIEIYNADTTAVDLNGWYLTDTSSQLTKWRFPATNLPPNSFLIVFASNKDRKISGRELHTNFRLNASPDSATEYLGLVRPDLSIASEYAPRYPVQVSDFSYGFPVTQTPVSLVSTGAAAKFFVPPNADLGTAWKAPAFDDSAWTSVNNGVGFETEALAPFGLAQIADSVTEFSGNQGQNGWYYGYYAKSADADGTYNPGTDFVQFLRDGTTVLSAGNHWNGTLWRWPNATAVTELSANGGVPTGFSGQAGRPTHWAVRRYVSESAGALRISGILACQSSNKICGDGVVGRIFVDGQEVYSQPVFGESVGYSILVAANVGSVIDFVIDPGASTDDSCDGTTFTAVVRTMAAGGVVADSLEDWSVSGTQGEKSWFYGYWDAVDDPAPAGYQTTNFIAFPAGIGPHSAANYWTGESWNWFDGDPPWTEIGRNYAVPNRIPNQTSDRAHEQWSIRRWVSEITGSLSIDLHVGKKDLPTVPVGVGAVTARVLRNGTALFTVSLTGTNFLGSSATVDVPNVNVGDAIDFTIEPGTDAIGDTTFFNATIYGTTTLSNQFVSNVQSAMRNVNASSYLRIPFNVTDATLNSLLLRVKYDDGFVAYINGTEVASANAPVTVAFNSPASAEHADVDAAQFETFNLTELRDLLQLGQNVLAIQGLNVAAGDADFLIAAELKASKPVINTSVQNYFSLPTPGSPNGIGTTNLGPLIVNVDFTPHDPADNEDVTVTARVEPTYNPVNAVRLFYRVMYQGEQNLPMFDDGAHGDGAAGDGVFGAVIPNTASTNGEMVRFYVTATDSQAAASRLPPFPDPLNSEQYLGTVVRNPALVNPLPVMHWFVQTPSQAETAAGTRCSIYWKGEFYDNVRFNIHGQSSSGFVKKSYNIDFNPEHHFLWKEGEDRVDDLNMLTTYPDKAKVRNIISYEIHGGTGNRSPHHWVVPVRVQQNSQFLGDWNLVENGDDGYLKRIKRDRNGALYKIYNAAGDANFIPGAEKKTRRNEDKSDLQALVAGTALAGQARLNYYYDNVDVSEAVDYLAAMILTGNVDCCHKNFYYYRDTEGDGEWEMFPWDVDLSLGRNWQGAGTGNGCSCYWDDAMYPQNGLNVGGNNYIPSVIFSGAPYLEMYRRRIRTLMDQMLQPTNTPPEQLKFEKRMDELLAIIGPDAALDLAKWTTWQGSPYGPALGSGVTSGPAYQSMAQAIALMKTNYFPQRRAFLYGQSAIPAAQPTNINILISSVDFNPSSGNQDQEYIMLRNTNTIYVDISGWAVTGAVRHVFQGGVVIPPSGTNFLVANKRAFRARTVSPKGGEGRYIEGPYEGQLSARGERLALVDTSGRLVSELTYAGNPTPAQTALRVTEIMYHPPMAPPGTLYTEDDFEYIELKNIGATPLDLTGVHFVTGVEFNFTGSAVTSLNPGEYVLIVKNLVAFTARYGSGFRIAGEYIGFLANEGENIRIDDAVGEKVLDFSYNNSWYPITDGPGASLVIVNENAAFDTWGLKASWRPSQYDGGRPGQGDPAPSAVLPVLVNEALTHTDLPDVDKIELYNPNTSAANISGWFISDDFTNPKKFRIPNGTTIAAGGYLVFTEDDFNSNPGVPPNFAFSSHGDEAYVFSGDGTNITGYFHGFSFGGAANGVSFGRYLDSHTNEHFVAQSATTFGAANAYPKVGPVVISEVMYHPPDYGEDNVLEEFVEIHNFSSNAVPLYDPAFPENTWHLRGGVDLDFPTNKTLGAGAFAMLVSFNPTNEVLLAQFRSRYNLAPSVPVFGPYDGKLDNSADSVRLLRPDSPDPGGIPYILVDEIDYTDVSPWPEAADGIGASLQRKVLTEYGNDSINWAGGLSPGANYGGTPPTLTSQSGDQTTIAGHTLTLSVGATGTEPLVYQWRLNGANLQGANSPTLVIPNIQPNQAGKYKLIVYNAAGSAESGEIAVVVQIPPRITTQPVNVNVRPGATTNFTVVAVSTTPSISYQWRFNGENIPGANGPTYTIANVGLANDGFYTVLVSDAVDTIESQAARLLVLINPVAVQSPLSQSVPRGGSATLSVIVTNTATLPITYQWRVNNRPVKTNIFNRRYDFFTLNNVLGSSNVAAGLINLAQPGGALSATAVISAIVDSDNDGIPDSWEAQYGMQTNDVSDATGDLDGDHMSNLAEYIAGTDPTNALSYLRVDLLNAPTGNSSATLTFPAVSNKTYTVEFADEIGVFQKLAELPARTTNRLETIVDPNSTARRFYRIATPVQP